MNSKPKSSPWQAHELGSEAGDRATRTVLMRTLVNLYQRDELLRLDLSTSYASCYLSCELCVLLGIPCLVSVLSLIY